MQPAVDAHKNFATIVKSKKLRERYRWIETAIRNVEKFPSKLYMQHFGLTEPQLSKDLANYYDHLLYLGAEADKYRSKITVEKWPDPGFAGTFSSLEWHRMTCPGGFVKVDQRTLAIEDQSIIDTVVLSIRKQVPIRVDYHSTTSGEREAILSPHALVSAVGRTHVRCYDHQKNDYRDFVIARMSSAIQDPEVSYVDEALDKEWHSLSVINLSIKGNLPPSQRLAISKSLGLSHPDHNLEISCRSALVRYEIASLGIPVENEESYFQYAVKN